MKEPMENIEETRLSYGYGTVFLLGENIQTFNGKESKIMISASYLIIQQSYDVLIYLVNIE